ncbi:hypothetical protein [Streptomyces sp. C10-9-1]|uniref:hypothetical protein n=1 Tax=Streptomyces sp. C10-9-1 TaxID=1859285 RepID=UPI003F4A5D49
MRKDIKNSVSVVTSLAPAVHAATLNGADVDLANYDAACFVFDIGVVTANDLVLTLEHADDDGTGQPDSYGAIPAADLDGTIPTATTATDEAVTLVGYHGIKRWVRAVVTDGGTGSGSLAVSVLRGRGRVHP